MLKFYTKLFSTVFIWKNKENDNDSWKWKNKISRRINIKLIMNKLNEKYYMENCQ